MTGGYHSHTAQYQSFHGSLAGLKKVLDETLFEYVCTLELLLYLLERSDKSYQCTVQYSNHLALWIDMLSLIAILIIIQNLGKTYRSNRSPSNARECMTFD